MSTRTTEQAVEHPFALRGPREIPSGTLTKLPLQAGPDCGPNVECVDGQLHFMTTGWYEVLLEVAWTTDVTTGTRFSHSKIPGQQPLHSEAIDGTVLARISEGRQLLRGNTVFGPDHTTELLLEVWHDAGVPVSVRSADLVVRELDVPWSPGD